MSTEVTVINDMDFALNKFSLRGMKRRKEKESLINLYYESTKDDVMTFKDIEHFRLENSILKNDCLLST